MARLIGGWSWTPQHEAEVPVALLQCAWRQKVPDFQQPKLEHPSLIEVLELLSAAEPKLELLESWRRSEFKGHFL